MRETGGRETKSAASQTAEPFYISQHITLPLRQRISALIGVIKAPSERRGRQRQKRRARRGVRGEKYDGRSGAMALADG